MFDSKLTWTKRGKTVTAAEINAVAERLGVTFPAEYVRYLESVNGGVPSRRMLACRVGDQTVSYFYELADLPREAAHFRSELDLPQAMIPIALAGQNIIVLNGDKAQLWYIIESGFEANRLCDLADSFDELLTRLQKKLVKPTYEKFIDAVDLGEIERVQKMIREGIDVNGGTDESAVDQAILGKEWKILEVLLAAGGHHDLIDGTSVGEALRGELVGYRGVLQVFGSDSEQGQRAADAIQDIERMLAKFFPQTSE